MIRWMLWTVGQLAVGLLIGVGLCRLLDEAIAAYQRWWHR